MQNKIFLALLACAISLSFNVMVHAADLPIDITAIGRQEVTGGQMTTRIDAIYLLMMRKR